MIKNDKMIIMGGACSTYVGEERCIQGFLKETSGKETTLKRQA
jgi:hypothetical protein